jgi:hypothetical protein
MTQLQVEFDEGSPEAARLKAIFGVDGEELEKRMQALAQAALDEYLQEMGGTKSASTIRGLNELRLSLLFGRFKDLGGLTDRQIGELFQMTRGQVGTLIDGARARFPKELEEQLKAVLQKALEKKDWDDEKVRIDVELPDSVVKYVRELINQMNAPPMHKRRELAGTYGLPRETAEDLCQRLEIPPERVLPDEAG